MNPIVGDIVFSFTLDLMESIFKLMPHVAPRFIAKYEPELREFQTSVAELKTKCSHVIRTLKDPDIIQRYLELRKFYKTWSHFFDTRVEAIMKLPWFDPSIFHLQAELAILVFDYQIDGAPYHFYDALEVFICDVHVLNLDIRRYLVTKVRECNPIAAIRLVQIKKAKSVVNVDIKKFMKVFIPRNQLEELSTLTDHLDKITQIAD